VLDKSLAHRKYWSFNAVCSKPKARERVSRPIFWCHQSILWHRGVEISISSIWEQTSCGL